MNHTVEFEWETYAEDDHSWDCLFVSVDGGPWKIAENEFGTQDTQAIRRMIDNGRMSLEQCRHW